MAKNNSLDTGKLYILESGVGKDTSIVFLHGVGSSSNMWLEHMKALDRFHCIAPDFPGHGQSNKCKWTNMTEVTDWVADIITSKCKGKAHVVGLSLGGGVGLDLVTRYPHLTDKVIIDGQSLKPIEGAGFAIAGVTAVSPFIHTKTMIKMVSKMVGITPDNMEPFTRDMKQVRPGSFRKAFRDANRISMPEDLSHIKSPILFVSGEKEAGIMHQTHACYAMSIPGSMCFFYPGKNHGWMAEDVQTHIDMCRYWFANGSVPGKLVSCQIMY